MLNRKKIKLCLVCTGGGHFEQMTNLKDFYGNYDHFWITNKIKQTENFLKNEKAYFIKVGHFKKPWTYSTQILPVAKIFTKERPTHIICTGSGRVGLIPFLVSRIMKINFIYIETYSRVNNHTEFANFLLKIGFPILTQWESGKKNTIYIGSIFKNENNYLKKENLGYVFVTVGTRTEPFLRLIKSVEKLIQKGVIKEKVIIQAGFTKYKPNYRIEIFDFCTPNKIENYILNAKYVITQESAGIGSICLKFKTRFIVMPREYKYGELPAKNDMKEDLHLKLEELGYTKVVRNVEELENAIKNIDQLKVGFNFNNTLAIQTLKQLVEGVRIQQLITKK